MSIKQEFQCAVHGGLAHIEASGLHVGQDAIGVEGGGGQACAARGASSSAQANDGFENLGALGGVLEALGFEFSTKHAAQGFEDMEVEVVIKVVDGRKDLLGVRVEAGLGTSVLAVVIVGSNFDRQSGSLARAGGRIGCAGGHVGVSYRVSCGMSEALCHRPGMWRCAEVRCRASKKK